jgi:proteasome accessory factor A
LHQPLFGLETEYAYAETKAPRRKPYGDETVIGLVRELQRKWPWLTFGGSAGVFLGNGGRFYIDTGAHPEYCTPECSNPRDLVRCVLAGDRILAGAARAIFERGDGEPLLFKSNVDYLSKQTWGCHESYLTRKAPEEIAIGLASHLATRVIYAGAGGFEPHRRGLGFVLSPRAYFLGQVRSNVSTDSRGMIHHRDEPLAGKRFRRLHVICGESLCSHQAQLLKVGTTALIVALIEQGRWHPAVSLAEPIPALHKLAREPGCKATLTRADTGEATPLDVQWGHLAAVERYANTRFLPDWSTEVCSVWRVTLERLELGPEAVATSLDWAIKLQIFTAHARARGFPWTEIEAWSAALQAAGVGVQSPCCAEDQMEMVSADQALARVLHRMSIDPRRQRAFMNVYFELLEIDKRFSQIGGNGIFDHLDAAGALKHGLPGLGEAEITAVVAEPPTGGRAAIRGGWIRRLANEPKRYHVNWNSIYDAEQNRHLDLSDPYGCDVDWTTPPDPELLLTMESTIARSLARRIRNRARPPAPPSTDDAPPS